MSKVKKLTTVGTVRIEKFQLNAPQTTQTSSRMMLCYLASALKGKRFEKFLIGDHGKSIMGLPLEFGQRLHCLNELQLLPDSEISGAFGSWY